MVLKLTKKVYFIQYCADLSKKSKSLEVISIYASESSHHTVSENGMFIGVWDTVHDILAIKI